MKRIYISGPMTGLPDFNFPAFNAEAERLRALGYGVINPAEINQVTQGDWQTCLRRDIVELMSCDTIALMPGWMNSNGAHLEMHIAHRVGIRVVESSSLVSPAVSEIRTNRQQMIDHIVLNVPHMPIFMFRQYFGTPDFPLPGTVEQFREHARRVLESGVLDVDVLYDDIEGNGELVDPLPQEVAP